MSNCGKETNHNTRHRGKSSESLLDKNKILENLSVASGQVVLDAGCGNGYMSREFAKLVGDSGQVYALDPDVLSIETLKAETRGENIEAFVGDITKQTDLPASSLDLIYLSTVVHGFSKAQVAGLVAEAQRLLKPKGALAIVEIAKKDSPFGPPLAMRYSPEELRDAIGLQATQCVEVGEFFYLQVFAK